MATLIDGYNLLHGTDLFGRGRAAGTLAGSRDALIRFVLSAIPANELPNTTIVFDAKDPPPGVSSVFHLRGLTIRFARGYADADELLEELIQAEHAPRSLLVVSSDHRIQQAARRRRAQFIDSHQWYFHARQGLASAGPAPPSSNIAGALSADEISAWERDAAQIEQEELRGTNDLLPPRESDSPATTAPARAEPAPKPPPQPKRRIGKRRSQRPRIEDAKDVNLANPFPPGYAEDELDADK